MKGKSSQVPLFLLEKNIEPILCTQPRRFAVVAIARMVAKARNCAVGNEVGYHIGHSNVTNITSARYFTLLFTIKLVSKFSLYVLSKIIRSMLRFFSCLTDLVAKSNLFALLRQAPCTCKYQITVSLMKMTHYPMYLSHLFLLGLL